MTETGLCKFSRRFRTFFVLFVLAGLLAYLGTRYLDTGGFVDLNHRVLENLQAIRLQIKEDEAATQGFLLTGSDDYLKIAERARRSIAAAQEALGKLYETEFQLSNTTWEWAEEQKQYLKDLSEPIDVRLDYTRMIVEIARRPTFTIAREEVRPATWACTDLLRELADDSKVKQAATGQDAARAMFALNRGQRLLDDALARLERWETAERKLLTERRDRARAFGVQLSEVIVALHFTYIAIVVGSLLLILIGAACGWGWTREPWFRFIHLLMIVLVVAESLADFECPLTTWERDLKLHAGMKGAEGDFIPRMLHKAIIYDAANEQHGWIFTAAYVVFGLLVIGAFWLAPPRFRRTEPQTEPRA